MMRPLALLSLLLLLAGFAPAQEAAPASRPAAACTETMVAAAHPLAVQAGVKALERGGTAMDAAVASWFVLAVVEPWASGIGGGGFIVHYDAASDQAVGYDSREIAPSGLTLDMVTNEQGELDGKLMEHYGMAVGVPGAVRGIIKAHAAHGKLEFASLLEPAIHAATEGFPVSPRFHEMLVSLSHHLKEDPATAKLFLMPDGAVPPLGTIIKQPELAATLKAIAEQGDAALYEGEAAKAIARTVQQYGGPMTAEDISNYEVRALNLLRRKIGDYEFVVPAPPSAGGTKLLAGLQALNARDPESLKTSEGLEKALYECIAQFYFVDQNVGDPRYMEMNLDELRDRTAEAINATPEHPEPGIPERREDGNTTHMVAMDADGNIVSMTQTINGFFGALITVPELGIVLNNELNDFTFERDNVNTPGPNKIPRSNMTPTIVFDAASGSAVGAIGSPGGRNIPPAVLQVLTRKLYQGLELQPALDAPRLTVTGDPASRTLHYEPGILESTVESAKSKAPADAPLQTNARKAPTAYFGGVHALWIDPQTGCVTGGADPRREGAAAGVGQKINDPIGVLQP